MSKKRRVFDIDFSDEDLAAPNAGQKPAERRGPMASAVRENAESVRDREARATAIREENDHLAHELVRLKAAGLITDLIAVESISAEKLARDRGLGQDEDLESLKTSVKDIGLSNPIQVEHLGNGKYELIQGYRRLGAWRALLAETGDAEAWGRIPAGIVASGRPLEELYRRMVDENLVRKDISFAEMAELARRFASDPNTNASSVDDAVLSLFKSTGKQKRSYIRAFAQLMERIGDALVHPYAMPRNLGLALRKRLDDHPDAERSLRAALAGLPADRAVEAELEVLQRYAGGAIDTATNRPRAAASERPAKTTFRLTRPGGAARCVASDGRLEIHLGTDFSAKDRRALESAVADFLASVGE